MVTNVNTEKMKCIPVYARINDVCQVSYSINYDQILEVTIPLKFSPKFPNVVFPQFNPNSINAI